VRGELDRFDSIYHAWHSVDEMLCDSLLEAPALVEKAQEEKALGHRTDSDRYGDPSGADDLPCFFGPLLA
jgi:hypothetical protein